MNTAQSVGHAVSIDSTLQLKPAVNCGTPLSKHERGGGVRSTLLLLGVNIPAGKGEHTAVMKSPPLFETVHQRIYRNENAILSKVLVTASSNPFQDEGSMLKAA